MSTRNYTSGSGERGDRPRQGQVCQLGSPSPKPRAFQPDDSYQGEPLQLLEKLPRQSLMPLMPCPRSPGRLVRAACDAHDNSWKGTAEACRKRHLANSTFRRSAREQEFFHRLYNRQSRGVAQPGSAPALGAGGRRFKSYRPDQYPLQHQRILEAPVAQTQNLGPIRVR